MRPIILVSAAAALQALFIPLASAHASLETPKAAAGGYKAVITVPHGCDGEATHTVRVELPEGFVSAKPMPKAGWTLAIEEGDYTKAYELHGRSVTGGARVVTWSNGNLPDGQFDEFVLRGTLAEVRPGDTLFFKTVQKCASGEVAWVDIPAAGQDAHALKSPAPALTILASDTGMTMDNMSADEAVSAGDLKIADAWARAMLPGQPAGGGYLTIENTGSADDQLLSVSSPAAGKVEVHTMEMKDNVMVMRPIEGDLTVPAGETVMLKPGGLHIMFMQVGTPFKEGATVPVTLEFEKAGKVDLELKVGPIKGGMPEMDHSGHGK